MKIVLACDSFKGSITAVEAVDALAAGLAASYPEAELVRLPLADGGEGTCETLLRAAPGEARRATVTGPLGEPTEALWALLDGGATAAVETASAAGLTLVPRDRRDPLHTTTRGLGELIRAAAGSGARRVLVGLGGSGTCDGGAGLAQALGYRLLDAEGAELPPGGGALRRLARIEPPAEGPLPPDVAVTATCDVDNPLLGPAGAATVYAPQKGADAAGVAALEAGLTRLAELLRRDLGKDVASLPGAGAAGGLGAGLAGFLGAELRPGIDVVLEAVRFEEHLEGADLVITGEGRLDRQTLHGKGPAGVARWARRRGVPVIAVAGQVERVVRPALRGLGLEAAFSLLPGLMSLEEALAAAASLLEDLGRDLGVALRAGRAR